MEQNDYNRLFDEIGDKRKPWDLIRKGQAHLLCPKTHDGDIADYQNLVEEQIENDNGHMQLLTIDVKKRRLEDAQSRIQTTLAYSVVVGLDEATAGSWLQEFKDDLNASLSKCDQCIRNWHLRRGPLITRLTKDYVEQVATIMELRYDAIDFARITPGLKAIEAIIDEAGPNTVVTPSHIIRSRGGDVLLPLLESLCSLRYLSVPEHRPTFNKTFLRLQEKKVLKLGNSGILPAMTRFLFDPDPIRQKFARTGWSTIREDGLTLEEWDWAAGDELTRQMQAVAPSPDPGFVLRFWDGLSLMLKSISKEILAKKLGFAPHDEYMKVKSPYFLAMAHFSFDSPDVLAALYSVFAALLVKAPDTFWVVFSSFNRKGVAQSFVTAYHIKTLFRSGQLVPNTSTPLALCWLRPLLDSLRTASARQAVAVEFLVPWFLEGAYEDEQDKENRAFIATGVWGALVTFQMAIDSYRDPSYKMNTKDSLIGISTILNKLVSDKGVIVAAAGGSVGDDFGMGITRIAIDLVRSALQLDSTAFWYEWMALYRRAYIEDGFQRNSAQLWEAVLDVVKPGQYQTSSVVMSAALQFLKAEPLIAEKHKQLPPKETNWNSRLIMTASVVERILGRLCDFNDADRRRFLADPSVMKSVVHALFNSNQDLSTAALEFIKSATDEDSRDDAILKLLGQNMRVFLAANCDAVCYSTGDHLSWGPILQILSFNKIICTALCDPGDGLLRTRSLNPEERVVVSRWWKVQWLFVHKALQETEAWSRKYSIEKRLLTEFVRDAMQFADDMIEQDAVFKTALSTSDGDSTQVMKRLLGSPQGCTGLSRMIRLRDPWLIEVIVKILTKLFNRLHEYEMPVNEEVSKLIKDTCMPISGSRNRFNISTNLLPTQRAQLLQALRVQVDDEEDDDDVVITQVKSYKPKKQTTIDNWSRGGTSSSIQDAMKGLTPTASSSSVLEQLRKKEIEMKRLRQEKEAKRQREAAMKKAQKEKDIKQLQGSIKEKRMKEKEEQERAKAAMVARARALRNPKPLVPGEGSGLQGIAGAKGKVAPAANKSELMINSDSEPEDDEDSEDGLQELLARRKESSHMNETERQLALRATAGPVKKIRTMRDEKSNRARIAPSMDNLHSQLLAWDIFHDGDDPPGSGSCLKVASSYQSPRDYKSTFFPLLIHEAWRAFVTARNECTQKAFGLKVTSRMSVDNFIEIATAIPLAENKDRFLSEGDIVIISRSSNPLRDTDAEYILARIKDTKIKQGTMDITYRVSRDPQSSLKPNRIHSGADLFAVKVTNMTTIEREFAALESLQHFDLCQEIINAQPSPMLSFSDEKVQATVRNYQLNVGQARAVLNATANDGFTLVQGPPGTGKTKTIVAMVGSLLTGSLSSTSGAIPVMRHGNKPPPTAGGPRKKLLVCAPSNAAVDEIVLRLKQGIRSQNSEESKINVLRLGRVDAINEAVKDVSLDELVKQRMDGDPSFNNGFQEKEALHTRAGELKSQLGELRPRLESARAEGNPAMESTLQREYDILKKEQGQIGRKIDTLKDKGNTRVRDNKIRRRNIEQEFIDKAHVVCTTLSGSGHHMFRDLKGVDFETVIIDEAAQCVELSALIPLKYGCIKCILVGDPKQLPPTVLSMSAQRYGYDQSLFVRMQQNYANYVHLLDHQYRMHPEISSFPSKEFYGGKLMDGGNMWEDRARPWHRKLNFGPYRFFNVQGIQSKGYKGRSLTNEVEIQVAVQLYHSFESTYGQALNGKIGIITPYKAQLDALRSMFCQRFGDAITERVEFNTTDAFQGRECEIIIFSCVRAEPGGGIGFVKDIRRMNVGLTRAKSSLWVLGNATALEQGDYWRKLIDDAKSRKLYTNAGRGELLRNNPDVSDSDLKPKPKIIAMNNSGISMPDAPSVRPGAVALDATSMLQSAPNTVVVAPTGNHKSASQKAMASGPVPIRPSNSIHPSSGMPVQQANSVNFNPPRAPTNQQGFEPRKRAYGGGGNGDGYPNKRNFSGQARPRHQDQDPAAMQVLGLVAPDRAPAARNGPVPPTHQPPRRPAGLLPGKNRAPQKGGNVFIQKPRRPPPK
ncbi:hypothetical protein MKZ38_001266 [Zalerion maritima]|uniref:Helicase SEN1 n=1 Tax=Zalerion maritima TaxID=339359 RepID=A0AAD5RY44_9PEZI|nr:hypothetical protein MKZ38_001266 [Zalerion maritima]